MSTTQINIGNYLKNRDDAKNSGTCLTCGASVCWGRAKLYSHKRAKCNVPRNEKHLWDKQPSIVTQLVQVISASNSGASCSNSGASSYAGSNSGASSYAASIDDDTPRPQKVRMMENFVDRINADEAGHIDTLISRFVYRTGIPFRVVDSNDFQELIKALRPAY